MSINLHSLLAGEIHGFHRNLLDGGEAVGIAQFGEQPGPEGHYDQSAYTSKDYSGDGAEPMGGQAGLEFAKFVGGADEDHVDGIDPAAHSVWRSHLHQDSANYHADHVAHAHQE